MFIKSSTIVILVMIAGYTEARSTLAFEADIPSAEFNVVTIETPSLSKESKSPRERAIQVVQEKLGLSAEDVVVKSMVTTDLTGITSVYLRQRFYGIEIVNADINVNIGRKGQVISFGSNIYRGKLPQKISSIKESIESGKIKTPGDCFLSLATFFKLPQNIGPLNIRNSDQSINEALLEDKPLYYIEKMGTFKEDIPVRVSYFQTDKGQRLELVYSYRVHLVANWYHAHVSVFTGKVEGLNDWIADASYQVFDINIADPNDGERAIISKNPDPVASPFGWHSDGKVSYVNTRGNNVWAQENPYGYYWFQSSFRPRGGSGLNFIFPFNQNRSPNKNKHAAITQLFYTINEIHDILYKYGFDEVSGNFQKNNADRGGDGDDFVIGDGLVTFGIDNAYFGTPPDGESGYMGMFLWYYTYPERDGIFDIGIVIHEYGHGLSNRLTGGRTNSDCLPSGQSGGMGEGWSDVLAIVFRQKPTNKRTDSFRMASYATGGYGIRNYPYSTEMSVNPSRFSFINKRDYEGVHAKGEVWAVILLESYWNLVDAYGFTPELSSASLAHGNTLFLHMIINAMKLQPCRPTFIQARDAILQAEEAITGGENACHLWRGFAKRGLGADSRLTFGKAINGYSLPEFCRNK